jgi:hypothetical protein
MVGDLGLAWPLLRRAGPRIRLARTRSLCQLRFGVTLDEVQSIVKPYADLHDALVFHSTWAKKFTCDDVELLVFAGESDALPRPEHRSRTIDLFRLAGGRGCQRRNKSGARVDRVLDLTWATPPTPVAGEGHASRYVPPAPSPFLARLCLYAPRPEYDGR